MVAFVDTAVLVSSALLFHATLIFCTALVICSALVIGATLFLSPTSIFNMLSWWRRSKRSRPINHRRQATWNWVIETLSFLITLRYLACGVGLIFPLPMSLGW